MSRISSLASNTLLVQQIFRTQQRVFDQQVQIASEKKSQDYTGIGTGTQRLGNLENSREALLKFVQLNDQVDTQFNITTAAVDGMREVIVDFRRSMDNYRQLDGKDPARVKDIQDNAFRSLQSLQDLLNTEFDGRFLFGGSRTRTAPVDLGLSTVAAFQAKYDGANVVFPTTRDARLEDFSFSKDENNTDQLFIDASHFMQFKQDGDGNAATPGSSTITATSSLFQNVVAGSTITVTGASANNGTYTVDSVATSNNISTITIKTEMLTDESNAAAALTYRDPDPPRLTKTIATPDLGSLTFNRANNRITAANAGALSAIPVGAKFTVSGTTLNNGDFTVSSNDGTNIVIEAVKLTDDGLTSGDAFFDYFSNTDVLFTAASKTIEVRQSGTTTPVANSFNGLAIGDSVTVAGSASNNGAFTVASIAADGSSITVSEAVTDETDTTGATFTSTASNFRQGAGADNTGTGLVTGTQMVITANDKIQIQDSGGTAVKGVFANLKVGMSIAATGTASNNQTFTISAISADGSTIDVNQDITVAETDTDGARLTVFAADGTISATPYYLGDELSQTVRVSTRRDFEVDLNAIDPAFEKAIRAMGTILQGKFSSEGGLDHNEGRIDEALFLLESSLERSVAGNPPSGNVELTGNIEQVQIDLGYDRVLLDTTNKLHKNLIFFLEGAISDVENIDQSETITKLLDDQRALEVSFQSFARIRQLSLVNFI